jgi:predicted amidohydrolase YtcJ
MRAPAAAPELIATMDRPADLVFRNGPVFRADPARSSAHAVAVRDGRIAAVGGANDVAPLIGPTTEVFDLDGRLLCPGFQDAHVHPLTGGLTLLRCNLMDAADRDAGLEAIARYAAAHPERAWVRGGGWRFDWFAGGMPAADLLDSIVPDRPAYLSVADGHAGWANSPALAAAGITAATPDPPDGRIERLPDGRPQGTLQEGAMDLVERVLPPETPRELDRGLLAGQEHLLSFGITAWQDACVTPEVHATYVRLAAAGWLRATVRGALWWERAEGLEQLEAFEERRRESTERYVAGSVKLMLDGVCENFTARMIDSYLDAAGAPTGNTGIDFIDPDVLPAIVTEIVRRGFQPHFHALGDAAVRSALDAVAAARTELGWTDVRPHIAHIQVIQPDDVPRFRRLGVTANAQALWACNEPAMTELTLPFLGEPRASRQYPFADLLVRGAPLAMGSDWSVSTPDVMDQVSVAVTRRVPGAPGSDPFLPEQRISVTDALCGFTAGSAHVNFLDPDRGTISRGAVADLVVLEGNPFESTDISGLDVALTVIDGDVVYERDGGRRR